MPTKPQLLENAAIYVAEANKKSAHMLDRANYAKVIESLSSVCTPDKVHLFGSRIIGLGHENSDLDIFIDHCEYFQIYWIFHNYVFPPFCTWKLPNAFNLLEQLRS